MAVIFSGQASVSKKSISPDADSTSLSRELFSSCMHVQRKSTDSRNDLRTCICKQTASTALPSG